MDRCANLNCDHFNHLCENNCEICLDATHCDKFKHLATVQRTLISGPQGKFMLSNVDGTDADLYDTIEAAQEAALNGDRMFKITGAIEYVKMGWIAQEDS